MIRSTALLTLLLMAAPPAQSAATTAAKPDQILVLARKVDRAARDALHAKLARTRVTVNFDELEARELATWLMAASGDAANFFVATEAELAPLTLQLKARPLTSLMAIIQDVSDIRFVFTRGAVKIQHEDEVKAFTELRFYDVRAATAPIPHRAGPKLGLRPPGDDFLEEDPADAPTTTMSGYTIDQLLDIVQNNVLPESWDRDDISINAMRGQLVVRQTEQGHAAVTRLLAQLGAITVPKVVVRPRRGTSPNRPIDAKRLRKLEQLRERQRRAAERAARERAERGRATRKR